MFALLVCVVEGSAQPLAESGEWKRSGKVYSHYVWNVLKMEQFEDLAKLAESRMLPREGRFSTALL